MSNSNNNFNTTLSILDLNTSSDTTKAKLRKLFENRNSIIEILNGRLHEKDSIIKALTYKIEQLSPPQERHSRSI